MKYLVAVSGGVDSVVLLDMLVRQKEDIVVAHFDHGIRSDSWLDAAFTKKLAKKYSVPFVAKREVLGEKASEEMARKCRYAFLFEEAKKHGALVVTAHHADDIIETIAINIIRGTGWRGLAVFDSEKIKRPLLEVSKKDIYEYALSHHLEWVEDSTNVTGNYLRNRVRRLIAKKLNDEQKRRLLLLRTRQIEIKHHLEKELTAYSKATGVHDRYFFIYAPETVSMEVLRALIVAKTSQSPTRPQLARALMAIKTAKINTKFELGGGATLRFTSSTFTIHTP